MTKSIDLVKNTFIIALGKISTQFLSFLLLPLYTAFLTPKDYGTVDLIVTYVGLLAPLVTIQLEMAAFRFLIDARGDQSGQRRVISAALKLILPVSLFLSLLALAVGSFIHIPYLHLIIGNIIATILANLFLQFARGMGNNVAYSIGSVIAGVTTIIANIVFIVGFHWGVRGMLLAIIIANLFCAFYLFLKLKLTNFIHFFKVKTKDISDLLRYSFPLVFNGISWWVINVSDRTIISIFLGLSANGIYAVSSKFAVIYASIFAIFSLSWTESVSVHINAKDRDDYLSSTINASLRLFACLGLIMIAVLPVVFPILVNERYSSAYLYAPILILAAFFNAIVGLYSAVYVAKKMTKQVASTSIVSAIVNVVLTLGFIKLFGLYAAAVATAMAYLVMAIYRHYDLKKHVAIVLPGRLLIGIVGIYSICFALYYLHSPAVTALNIVFVTVVSLLVNRSTLQSFKRAAVLTTVRRRSRSTGKQA